MDLLSNLKSLIGKVHFSNVIQINSHNDNRQITLNVTVPIGANISTESIEKFRAAFQKLVADKNINFLATTSNTTDTLQLIADYEKSTDDRDLRKFIKEKLPSKDKSLWFSALILRQKFSQGEVDTVNHLKREMNSANPPRGGNIANLCSAKYLESHILPLYQFLVEENKNQQLFLEIYETIVLEFPFAVFVSQHRSDKAIKEEIMKKITTVKKYGWKKVAVHGIGEENVRKIMRVTVEIETENTLEISSTDVNSHRSNGKTI